MVETLDLVEGTLVSAEAVISSVVIQDLTVVAAASIPAAAAISKSSIN